LKQPIGGYPKVLTFPLKFRCLLCKCTAGLPNLWQTGNGIKLGLINAAVHENNYKKPKTGFQPKTKLGHNRARQEESRSEETAEGVMEVIFLVFSRGAPLA
jgi:hypothetical protein